MLLGDYYYRARDLAHAEDSYRQAWDKTNKADTAIEQKLASFLVQQGKFDAALDVLKANADKPEIVRTTLETHILAKHTDQAEKGLNEALAKTPDSTELLDLLASVYLDGHRYQAARALCQRILKLDPNNDDGLWYQAMTELRDPAGGDMELAQRDLQQVV